MAKSKVQPGFLWQLFADRNSTSTFGRVNPFSSRLDTLDQNLGQKA